MTFVYDYSEKKGNRITTRDVSIKLQVSHNIMIVNVLVVCQVTLKGLQEYSGAFCYKQSCYSFVTNIKYVEKY